MLFSKILRFLFLTIEFPIELCCLTANITLVSPPTWTHSTLWSSGEERQVILSLQCCCQCFPFCALLCVWVMWKRSACNHCWQKSLMHWSISIVFGTSLELLWMARKSCENGTESKTNLGWKLFGLRYRLESVGLVWPLCCSLLFSLKLTKLRKLTDLPNWTSFTGNFIPFFNASWFNDFTKLSNDLLDPFH